MITNLPATEKVQEGTDSDYVVYTVKYDDPQGDAVSCVMSDVKPDTYFDLFYSESGPTGTNCK